MIVLATAAVMIVSYLIGSVNSSIIISKLISGKDIRESGSGNAGATNMLRTHGKKIGVITLLIDVLKGVVAVLIAKIVVEKIGSHSGQIMAVFDTISLPYIAGACVMLGHNYPIFFGFKGGKGVATSLGAVYVLDWKLALILTVCGVGVIAITKYVSFGSVLAGIAFIVAETVNMIFTGTFGIVRFVCDLILGGMLVFRHKENIKRLLNGTENKLGSKKK